jgi:hypothetical protein
VAVIGAVSAVGDSCAGGVQKFLGVVDAGDGVERCGGLCVVNFRQSVNLLDIKN